MSPSAMAFVMGSGTIAFILAAAVLIMVPPMSVACAGAVLSTPSIVMTILGAILWNVR